MTALCPAVLFTANYKRSFSVVAILFAAVCVFFFQFFYKEAQGFAIVRLNDEQTIHAKQAARGIEDFFAMWRRSLVSLSKMDSIIDADTLGRRNMELFQEANREQIGSITRLDERGVILYNFPSSGPVGTDISAQKHVRELLREHRPVISDVFKSVEGTDAIALHVPVFRGGEFKGSIGVLIDFRNLARRYLDVIKIGETGYAWVISRDGTILYTPVSGLTGKSVLDIVKEAPALAGMVDAMLKGDAGVAEYTYHKIRDQQAGPTRKFAVYEPARIENTFWSIAVASAEQDVLSGLITFRNKLAWVSGALFICGMGFSRLGVKAWLIVKAEEARKLADEKLRESEERYRTLFQRANDGILVMDADGNLISVNDSFARMHGYSTLEMVGMNLTSLDTPESARLFPERMRRILAGETMVLGVEHFHKDGHVFPLEVSAGRIPINGVPHIQAFHRDITRRKQAELELEQQRDQLTHLSRVATLGELSSTLAHELNQPLTAILSNAQAAQRFLAKDPPDLAELREILADIVKEDERACEIIRRLRLLLKKGEMERQTLDANEIVTEVLKLVRGVLANQGVAVETTLAPDLPAIRGDRVQLQQVLLNLIMNACDAMANNQAGEKFLTLRTDCTAEAGVHIEVCDSGTGLPAGGVEQAFERFFTTKPHGLGLGLSVCHTIITAHGGTLGASNNVGPGATFTCCLPVATGNR